MTEMTEKREYFRINIDCEIECRDLASNETHQARCSTLSGAGISFIAAQEFQIGTELEVTIQSQLPSTPPMRAHVKVIRAQVLEDQTFEIGATMTVLPDDDYLSL